MPNRGFVCWRCHLCALRRSKAPQKLQWLSSAKISSAVQTKPATDDKPIDDSQPLQQSAVSLTGYDGGESRLLELFLNNKPFGAPRPHPRERPSRFVRDAVLHLAKDEELDTDTLLELQDVLPDAELGAVTKLDKLLSHPGTLETAWAHFLKNLSQKDSPHRIRPAYQDFQLLQYHAIFGKLLLALTRAWVENPQSTLPKPTLVLRKLEEAAAIRPKFYLDAAWIVAKHLLHRHLTTSPRKLDRTSDLLLADLIDQWGAMFIFHGDATIDSRLAGQTDSPNWNDLEVRARQFEAPGHPANFRVEVRLQTLLKKQPSAYRMSLSALGLVSYDLLLRLGIGANLSPTTRAKSNGLARVLALIIHRRPLDRSLIFLHELLKGWRRDLAPSKIKEYIRKLASLPNETFSVLAPEKLSQPLDSGRGLDESLGDSVTDMDRLKLISTAGAETMFIQVILKAGRHHYGARLENIWENVAKYYSETSKCQGRVKIPIKVYRLLLCELLALQKRETAARVMKFMINNDTQPTVKEYTAMMSGCRRAKDLDAAERLWNKMTDSGLQPDAFAWTDRISALMNGGRYHEAIAVLDDMKAKWMAAVEKHAPSNVHLAEIGDLPGAAKPRMCVVNAVLAGILKWSRDTSRASRNVLRWASEIGVEPDSVTFTILIQIALARRDINEASEHLQQMAAANIEPDPEIFSVILNDAFRSSAGRSLFREQPEQRIMQILSYLERFGWHKNHVILQILVDCLLKQHDNHDAAMTVVLYMGQKGVMLSEHMYTSFITYYFTRDPPDIKAVDLTVARLQRLNRTALTDSVDNYLYDRLVEGYARCGEVAKMMQIFWRMSHQGRRTSWSALNEALAALLAQERFDLVDDIVADLRKRKLLRWAGFASIRPDERAHENRFLRRVQELRKNGLISTGARASEDFSSLTDGGSDSS